MSQHIEIIAEAGVNHNGSVELAKELVDAAVAAGADCVKFQTFKGEKLAARFAAKAEYQKASSGLEATQLEMIKRLELSEEDHLAILMYCKKKNIRFLSTPFDIESMHFLVEKLQVDQLKIASGDITNAPLLFAVAQTHKPLILSTGMSTLGEVESALSVLAYGLCGNQAPPNCSEDLRAAFYSKEGQRMLQEQVTILHCVTEYPAPYEDLNLSAIHTLKHAFKLPVGFSDHSLGIYMPIAAAAIGATVIEKHFTLDKSFAGPDHKASLDPYELKELVIAIRQLEKARGNGIKIPQSSELKNSNVARRSIVAGKKICKGDIFSTENLETKRPGTGLSPFLYWSILGKISERDYEIDEEISA